MIQGTVNHKQTRIQFLSFSKSKGHESDTNDSSTDSHEGGDPSQDDVVTKPKSESRIPLALQKVFVESCQGIEVNVAAEDNVASKTFERKNKLWVFQSPTRCMSVRKILSPKKRSLSLALGVSTNNNKDMTTSCHEKIATKPATAPIKKSRALSTLAPQDYLDGILRSRGYSTKRYLSLETGYYSKATPLQQASYASHLVSFLRKGDDEELRKILCSGISPNPSNQFGESLAHLACRLKSVKGLQVMHECGCDIRCADDKGRTPLHDACWSYKPCFELVEVLLTMDIHLLMIADIRGCLPLSYAPRESWSDWLTFLAARRDIFWPKRSPGAGEEDIPPLALEKPNSRPAPQPKNAFSLQVAGWVANGKIKPEDGGRLTTVDAFAKLIEEHRDPDDDDSSYEDLDSDDDDHDDNDEEEDDDSVVEIIAEEKAEQTSSPNSTADSFEHIDEKELLQNFGIIPREDKQMQALIQIEAK